MTGDDQDGTGDEPEIFSGGLAAIAAEELAAEVAAAEPPSRDPRPDLVAPARRPSPRVVTAGLGVAFAAGVVLWGVRRGVPRHQARGRRCSP